MGARIACRGLKPAAVTEEARRLESDHNIAFRVGVAADVPRIQQYIGIVENEIGGQRIIAWSPPGAKPAPLPASLNSR